MSCEGRSQPVDDHCPSGARCFPFGCSGPIGCDCTCHAVPADEGRSFDHEADARENHARMMGHDLPVEERRERALARRQSSKDGIDVAMTPAMTGRSQTSPNYQAPEGWFTDVAEDDDGKPTPYWQPVVQVEGCCFPLPVWHETEAECDAWIDRNLPSLGRVKSRG